MIAASHKVTLFKKKKDQFEEEDRPAFSVLKAVLKMSSSFSLDLTWTPAWGLALASLGLCKMEACTHAHEHTHTHTHFSFHF